MKKIKNKKVLTCVAVVAVMAVITSLIVMYVNSNVRLPPPLAAESYALVDLDTGK